MIRAGGPGSDQGDDALLKQSIACTRPHPTMAGRHQTAPLSRAAIPLDKEKIATNLRL